MASTNQRLPCDHRFCKWLSIAISCLDKCFKRHGANIFAALFMLTSLTLNVVQLVLTHERVPLNETALPDIVFDLTPYYFNAFAFSEIFIGAQNICFFLLLVFHPEREIILRRFMFILGIVYLFRIITFSCTQLPCPFDAKICLPKLNNSLTVHQFVEESFLRFLKHSSTLGFVSNEKRILCGDFVFSGHTHIVIVVYLFINTYFFMNKQRNKWLMVLLENLHFAMAFAAITCVVISRQHYTVDVVLSYYITTRLFWTYHSLCLEKHMFQELRHHYEDVYGVSSECTVVDDFNEPKEVSQHLMVRDDPNMISQVWWWPLFIYLEIIKKPPAQYWPEATASQRYCVIMCFRNRHFQTPPPLQNP